MSFNFIASIASRLFVFKFWRMCEVTSFLKSAHKCALQYSTMNMLWPVLYILVYEFCTISVQVRILSSLDHPSIIHYYGTAVQNNVHYIVTG